MSFETDQLTKRLLKCLDEIDNLNDDLDTWTNSLEELSEIVDAFESEDANGLHGKTILDVGTDCVKPLYIALKFKPEKIVGINEELHSSASDIEQKSKLLTETKIHFYSCSLFDKENLKKILKTENVEKFNYVLVSKTLHHLRTGRDCVASRRDQEHKCRKDEKCCIYKFKPQVFEDLLGLGDRVIVYEAFYPHEEDDDKVRGRGGYFTVEEWKQVFEHLSEKYDVQFIKPKKYRLGKSKMEKVKSELRKVDFACFYVQTK